MKLQEGYSLFRIKGGKVHIREGEFLKYVYLCGLSWQYNDNKENHHDVTEPEICKRCLAKYKKLTSD